MDRDPDHAYRSLHAALYGTPWPRPSWGTEIREEALVEMQAEYDAKVSRLSHDQRHVITNVCVFDERPMWFYCRMAGLKELPEDERERELLLTGLDAVLGRQKACAA